MRYWILVRKLLLSKKDLVPGISVEGASTIYLRKVFSVQRVKCPLLYVPIGLATGGQVNVVHQQSVMCFGRSFGRRRVASTRGFGYVGEEPRVREFTGSKLSGPRGLTQEMMRRMTDAEMDKGIMVADGFRSEQRGVLCRGLALAWK
ncbi:hypothetical protein TNCV_842871 [Trichonephila clavipes]|nr:hypothetical protein TNCV_842871 [Trichonephila clavipes]